MLSPTWESDCGTVKLWLGDCLDVMQSWPDGAVDAVVTDPPYGARRPSARRSAGDRFTEIVGNKSIDAAWVDVAPLAVCGACYSFCTWDTLERWREALSRRWRVRSCIVWDKVIHGLADLATCWAPQHELILFAANGRHELSGERPRDVIRCQRVDATKLCHPYEKPVALIEQILRAGEGLVADPFMGSGTTGVAAVRLGRKFWGVEIDPEYFEIAKRRIQDELRKVEFLEPERAREKQLALIGD